MPRDPEGRKRPADTVANAVHVMRIATGEVEESSVPEKNAAAVSLGRLGGLKGGKARAEKLSEKKRKEIAKRAAKVRWAKK